MTGPRTAHRGKGSRRAGILLTGGMTGTGTPGGSAPTTPSIGPDTKATTRARWMRQGSGSPPSAGNRPLEMTVTVPSNGWPFRSNREVRTRGGKAPVDGKDVAVS